MNTSLMMNVITMQRHIFNANTSMDISTMMNILTTQLGTSCSFDSPGLARNEPTPGQLTQGSLHYRLATLGYQKRNTYGVETCVSWCD